MWRIARTGSDLDAAEYVRLEELLVGVGVVDQSAVVHNGVQLSAE